jgi:hypothetical protein
MDVKWIHHRFPWKSRSNDVIDRVASASEHSSGSPGGSATRG